MTWFEKLGEKTSRTDIWVILYTVLFITCSVAHFFCGFGIIEACTDSFLSYNRWILSTLILGIMADLGIKQWKNTKQ